MGAWSKYAKLLALSLSTIHAKFHQNRFINVDFSILPYMGRDSRGAGAWSKHEKLFALTSSTIHMKAWLRRGGGMVKT